ncbi:MAG: single-stranded DNA-binding protein [Mycoplasmatales bacterium]
MVNNVTLVGRITKAPELRYGASGNAACNFTLACNRNFKNANGEYDADFINCTVFGATAERMEQYVQKGALLAVTGRIQTRNYDNNAGQRVYVTEVVASNVTFLEPKSNGARPQTQSTGFSPYDNVESAFNASDINSFSQVEDDDLPF